MPNHPPERRSGPRKVVDKYYSVEFSIGEFSLCYQFRIWNMSEQGMCLLVKEDSDVLRYITVGDVLDMKYHGLKTKEPAEYFKTKIEHITKTDEGRYVGHYLVGISIVGNGERVE
ncbi:conserved hypothetical protein [uncultured Desulfobacterium sp.]|uniref:PilZ domain-containing protein n=1 Tax=uncultured Desulfobacterium sp. TaxID=201089 RepID=A0A445N347_9BACT|nr:conserved hypothetical protein [uncultured Desulfobacterium sp.]